MLEIVNVISVTYLAKLSEKKIVFIHFGAKFTFSLFGILVQYVVQFSKACLHYDVIGR